MIEASPLRHGTLSRFPRRRCLLVVAPQLDQLRFVAKLSKAEKICDASYKICLNYVPRWDWDIFRYEWTAAQVICPQLCGTSFHHLSLPTPCKAMKDQMGIILLNSRIFGESRKVKLPPRLKDFIKKDLRGHNQHTSHSSLFVGVMVLDVLVLVRIFATFQLFCYTSPDFGDWHGKVEDIR